MGSSMGKGSSNFLESFPIQGTVHLVMLGLDSAGKTTALYRLKFDQYLNTVPTIGFNCEKVQGVLGKSKGIQFIVWDVGGQEKLRPLWRSYTRCTDGILFVVDSVDIERMEEAKMELMKTAKCPDNQGVPVLILANKQDLPGARDSKELEKLLGLNELLLTSWSAFQYKYEASSDILNSSKNTKEASIKKQQNENFKHSETDTELQKHRDTNGINTKVKMDKLNSGSKSLTRNYAASSSELSGLTENNLNKHWYIQPTCAITGDGLHEGLEVLYNMILKRKKFTKGLKKKR